MASTCSSHSLRSLYMVVFLSLPLPLGEGAGGWSDPPQTQPLSLWERVAEGRSDPSQTQPLSLWERVAEGRVRAPQQPCPYIPLLHPMGCLRRGPSPQPSPRGRGGRELPLPVSPEGVGTACPGFSRGGRNCFSWFLQRGRNRFSRSPHRESEGPPTQAGRNFGRDISSVMSSKLTSTGRSQRTSSGLQPMTLESMRAPSSSSMTPTT